MRTAIFIVAGFVLWGICLGAAKLTGAASTTVATTVVIVLWFIAAAVNMWAGIARAGYSFQEELPIFLLIFLLPAVVALLVNWKFLAATITPDRP